MTDFDTPRLAVERTIANAGTGLDLVYDNQPSREGEFVRVLIESGTVLNAVTGGGSNLSLSKSVVQRHGGSAVFEVNVPINKGTARAYEICNRIEPLFANETIDGVVFKNSEVVRFGETDAHYRVSLFIHFYRDSR